MQPATTLQNTAPAAERGGFSANALKWVAIAAMLIDHTAWLFVGDYYGLLGSVLHAVGRITGPTMFFFIAEGYHRTRNANRYTLRLFLFAVVSYLPFIYFQSGALPARDTALHFNVIYTLFLGLLAVRARHEVQSPVLRVVVIGLLLVLSQYGDWGHLAILFILAFDIFRGNFAQQAFAYTAIVLVETLPTVFNVMNALLVQYQPVSSLTQYFGFIFVKLGMFLPLLLLYFYNGKKGRGGRMSKWAFYIFYPLHLVLLRLLYTALGQPAL